MAKWVRNSGRGGREEGVGLELSKGGGGKRAWDRARASDLCSMQIPFDRSV